MTIYLKSNWSEQFIYGDKTPGFFVGRKQEIKSLKSVISGNNSSAILVSSVRGVGKTSFVHKTLSEIKNVQPVFVNIGHALANADVKKEEDKKLVLVSLIRAAHFSGEFKDDPKLGDLYKKCFAEYREEDRKSTGLETKKESGIQGEFKVDIRTMAGLLSVLLVAIGLNLDNLIARLITGLIGISALFLSFSWKKSWTENITSKKLLVIDNSTEYLEIEFENWLRAQDKSKKIVFVIDELDKIEDEKSLKMIKEYKNLFNRSFAHFVFIASHNAFDLISRDREKDVSDGGIFPTLFTHVFYLSLPRTEELKDYLNEIFIFKDVKEDEKKELIHYLLFKSGNDFFELKRLISDVIFFDEKEEPYIDTDKIKEGDSLFARISSLFEYLERWFLQKNMRDLKKHWKANSDLQKSVFSFLNKNFSHNFSESDVNSSLKNLIRFLLDIGILEQVDSTDKSGTKITIYQWTGKYKRNVKAPLLDEDEKFNKSFRELIKLANDLDDIQGSYKTGQFTDYESVSEDQDGSELSGINLYSVFSDYKDIFKKLKEPFQRISVTVEKTKEAREIIDEQTSNVYEKYFEITINFLNKIFKGNPDIFKNESIDSANHNIKPTLDSLPEFLSVVTPSAYTLSVFGRTDQTKYVLLIRHFEDEESIAKALSALKSRPDILVFNLMHGERHQVTHPKTFIDRLGRKRKKGVEVKNFIDFEFNDFRQLSKVFNHIEKHLG